MVWLQESRSVEDLGMLPCQGERVSRISPLRIALLFRLDTRQDPLVRYEFEEIKSAIAKDREAGSWLSLITTPGNRRRMRIIIALAIFSQWSGNGLV